MLMAATNLTDDPRPRTVRRSTKKSTGEESTGEDFQDPHWKLDEEMVTLLREEGFSFKVERVEVEKLRFHVDHQPNQVRESLPDPEVVASYRATLQRGRKLPTITIDDAYDLIDAYHRLLAAVQAELSYVYVIRVTRVLAMWEKGVIATRRNNMHGKRMSTTITMKWVLSAVSHGMTLADAAEKFEMDPSTLRRHIAIETATEKAQALGIEEDWAKLTKTVKLHLANNTTGMYDKDYRAIVRVLAQHAVKAGEAQQLVDDVMAVTSAPTKRTQKIVDIDQQLSQRSATQHTMNPSSVVYTSASASKEFLQSMGIAKAALTNTPLVTALLGVSVTDSKFGALHDALLACKEPFEKLCVHFGA
jgi:hypothetical protein